MANSSNSLPYPGWDIVRRIGGGSFGSVYEIEREVIGWKERAALKVIPIPKENDQIEQLYSEGYDKGSITAYFDDCLKSVVREYGIMAEMKGHPNIVYCDDIRWVQHDDGIGYDVYIKMELLRSLTRWLKEEPARDGAIVGPLDEEGIRKLGKDMCAALIQCRQFEIIHRDIKPDNILVTNSGAFKLGDFGVAKISALTASGTKAGSYNYMSPEVYRSMPYSQQADIYSLGLVLYWLLNERRLPFLPLPPAVPKYEEIQKALDRRMSGERLPEPKNGSDDLKAIVLKACEYGPRRRYATADELLRALEALPEANKEPEPDGLEETIVEETDERKVAPKTAPPPKPEEPPQEPEDDDPPGETPPEEPPPGPEDDDPPWETPPEMPPTPRKRPAWITKVCVAALVLAIMGMSLWGVRRLTAPMAETPAPENTPKATALKGKAGDLSWTLEDGTLTVSGSGPMKSAPWKDSAGKIKKVVIEEGVTSIGNYAFNSCSSLTSITIPDGVASIGNYAFNSCSSLTSITIPDGVASIGNYAFNGCSSLTSITIPDDVASIGNYVFNKCSSLTSITIPDGVASIGNCAFNSCYNLTSVTLPDSVTSIGNYAFYDCDSLTSIPLPDGVTSIGDYAFGNCDSLTDVSLPDSVPNVGRDIFSGSSKISITQKESYAKESKTAVYKNSPKVFSWSLRAGTLTISGTGPMESAPWSHRTDAIVSVVIEDDITSIEYKAFELCDRLTSVSIPDSVTSIGYRAFAGCTSLASITIPDSVTSIEYRAFAGCTGLASITIPDGVTSIGWGAFKDCPNLTVYAPKGSYAEKYAKVNKLRFAYSTTGKDGTTSVENAAETPATESKPKALSWSLKGGTLTVSGNGPMESATWSHESAPWSHRADAIVSVIIEDGVTSIEDKAFAGCANLTSITIPASVTSIGDNAFDDCPHNLIIYAPRGSYAEKYAKENGIRFVDSTAR